MPRTSDSDTDDSSTDHQQRPLSNMELSKLRRRLRNQDPELSSVEGFTLELGPQSAIDFVRALQRNDGAASRIDFTCRLVGFPARRWSNPPPIFLLSSTVKEIDLSHTVVGDGGAAVIAQLLPYLAALENLLLRQCDIKNAGIEALSVALRSNCRVEKLDLSWNRISSIAAVNALCDLIRQNTALWELSLDGLRTSDQISLRILSALSVNYGLGIVDIHSLVMHWRKSDAVRAGQLIASMIQNCEYLWSLGLSNCFHLDGLEPIVEALCSPNCNVSFLDLSGRKRGKDFLPMISRILRESKSLTALALRGCGLESSSPHEYLPSLEVHPIVELERDLRNNVSIDYLDLRNNEVGAVGANALVDVLSSNCTLQHISLGRNFSSLHYGRRPYGNCVAPPDVLGLIDRALALNKAGAIAKKVFKVDNIPMSMLKDSFPDALLPLALAKFASAGNAEAKDEDEDEGTCTSSCTDAERLTLVFSLIREKNPAFVASLRVDLAKKTKQKKPADAVGMRRSKRARRGSV